MKRPAAPTRILSLFLALILALALVPQGAGAASPVNVSARGAIVMDFQTGEIYFEKEADVARPIASMTKLMSLYLVFDAIDAGKLSLSDQVPISVRAMAMSNNRAYSGYERFRRGSSHPAETLLGLIMTASCNASVLALAEHLEGTEAAFVEKMNAKAAQWGIDAHFADCTGYIDEGNAVTPRAMAEIARRILTDHPEILNYSRLPSVYFQGNTFYSTNLLLRNNLVAGIDGLKTGHTGGAGFCFTGTAIRDGARIISVVMGTDSGEARMAESRKLLEYGFTCRKEREESWRRMANTLQARFSVVGGTAFPYTESRFTATVSGAEGVTPCKTELTVDGKPCFTGELPVANDAVAEGTAIPQPGEKTRLALQITLPNGTVVRREGTVEQRPLTFSGWMGVPALSIYMGSEVRLSCHVRCDQGAACAVPAGWYLDGKPIMGYQNPSFAFPAGGEMRTSAFTFRADRSLSPGPHTLELRLNPEGLTGAQKTAFSTQIEILSLPAGAERAAA